MSTKPFKFLEEKPLQTTEEFSSSKFGHEEIANTLVKIVKECPAPFTVGLFAKWGSGKSTVANSVLEKLPKQKVPVILFDVWKHEGDALRRTFLKETVRQLKAYGPSFFDMDFVLDEKIQQSVTRSAEGRITIKKELAKQLLGYFPYTFFCLTILILVFFYFDALGTLWKDFLSFFSFASGGVFLLWLLKGSVSLFSAETVVYGVDKFEDPHQFEEEFGRILSALKNPRVLVVFDNLDRVVHDKVAEVLATIKTFLEPQDIANNKKEVVFLVPCDAKAIKQHLTSVYGSSNTDSKHTFDPDEFLRKFFNTIVWIPDFIPSELEAFARSCLKETGIEILDNDYVAWIITKAFRNNPRQVIQFTNILLANYLLVMEREGEGKDFEVDFLKNHIAQLTKYLVLNQLFPEEMDILRERKILNLADINNKGNINELNDIKSKDNFLSFVEQTKNIPINDLRAFFTLRRSAQEKKFPGFSSFVSLLEDRQIDDAKKYFSQFGDFSQPDFITDFSQAIKTELEGKTNPVSTISLIFSLFTVLLENKLSLSPTLYEEISHILNSRCKEELHTVPPDVISEALLVNNSAYRESVISQWLVVAEDILIAANKYKSNKDFIKEVFAVFAKHPEYLTADQMTKVTSLLTTYMSNDIEVLDTVNNSQELQAKIITGEYVRKFLTAIPNTGTLDDIFSRLEKVNMFTSTLLEAAGIDFIVEKYTDLVVGENTHLPNTPFTEKYKLFDPFRKFLEDRKDLMIKASITVKDKLADSLIVAINQLSDYDQKSVVVPILLDIRPIVSTAKVAEVDTYISAYTSSVTPVKFDEMFKGLSEEVKSQFFETAYYQIGATRALSNPDFRIIFFSKLSDTKKTDFLLQLFNSNNDAGLSFIESLDKKELKHVWTISDTLWVKFDSFSVTQKERLFKFINKNEGGNSAQIRDTLATKITTTLQSPDPILQQAGLTALGDANSYLAESKKRLIAKESFDWLKKPETVSKYQLPTIKAIFSEIKQFDEKEQSDLIQFTFDEIIRKADNIQQISEGFEMLKKVGPKYEDRKQNYDDIKSKIEVETNESIKTTMINGLATLKPSKVNQKDKDFWDWVEAQLSFKG